jgi:hypothetical protein
MEYGLQLSGLASIVIVDPQSRRERSVVIMGVHGPPSDVEGRDEEDGVPQPRGGGASSQVHERNADKCDGHGIERASRHVRQVRGGERVTALTRLPLSLERSQASPGRPCIRWFRRASRGSHGGLTHPMTSAWHPRWIAWRIQTVAWQLPTAGMET